MKPTIVAIDTRSIIRVLFVILILLLAWKIRFIILSLIAAFIFMSGAAILADWLHARGLNKSLAAVVTYLFLIVLLALTFFLVIPPLIKEIQKFIEKIPEYANTLNLQYSNSQLPVISNEELTNVLTTNLNSVLGNVLNFLISTVNGLLTFFTIAILSFYLLLERDRVKSNLFRFFPHLPKERVTHIADKVEKKIGAWLRGELILMLIVGSLTFLGLTLLKIEYALPLAIIAGLLEAVPVIGPVISSIPAIFVTLVSADPIAAVGVAALYIIIQQLENNILVPKVMEGTVGLSPLVTILALLVGASLFGIVGAILAVPVATMIAAIVEDFIEHSETSVKV